MILEVEGVQFNQFSDATATVSVTDFSGTFSFTAVTTSGEPLPLKGNESCRVIVEGIPIITGFIEHVDVSYDDSNHTVVYSGRDRTSDIGDSDLNVVDDIKGSTGLVDAISKVIASIPGTLVRVGSDAGVLAPFSEAEDILAPGVGQNAFEFIEQLARKRQVLLTTDGLGNILITKTSTEKYKNGLRSLIGDKGANNVLSATAVYDFSDVYRRYIVKSQLNPSALNIAGLFAPKTIVEQKGDYEDVNARAGRQIVVSAEQSSGDGNSLPRAEWESNIRQARSRVYTATVLGFLNVGELWRPNRLVSVIDQFAGIDDVMLIESVTYSIDSDGGEICNLTLIQKDSFILASEEPVKKKKGNVGNDFIKSFS